MPISVKPEKISEAELNILKDTLVYPYKLINSPLFRCRLFETEEAVYLYIDVHHLIFDGTSFTIFMNSVINAYLGAPLETDYYYLVLTNKWNLLIFIWKAINIMKIHTGTQSGQPIRSLTEKHRKTNWIASPAKKRSRRYIFLR